jgi:hypothetical protein
LAKAWKEKRAAYKDKGLVPTAAAIKAGNREEGLRLLNEVVTPLYDSQRADMLKLVQLQIDTRGTQAINQLPSHNSHSAAPWPGHSSPLVSGWPCGWVGCWWALSGVRCNVPLKPRGPSPRAI